MNGITAEQRSACNRTLLAAVVATVVMLFTGFAAAYLERSTSGATWERITFPPIVLVNTAILVASSIALEWARRHDGKGNKLGIALGFAFVIGQTLAFFQLREAGVFVSSNSHASFFYLLTGLHALHVVGGLIALLAALRTPRLMQFARTFWHFMGGIWIYVLAVLTIL